MTPEQRASYKTDLPTDYISAPDFQPFRDVLKGLDDAQIDALVRGDALPIDPSLFPDQIALFNKRWYNAAVRQRNSALAQGQPDPYPAGVPDVPPMQPALSFRCDDYDEDHPERAALYGLALQGVALTDSGDMHMVFDPIGDSASVAPIADMPDDGQIIDLTPWLQAPDVTPEQRGDIGFTVHALAEAANVPLYQEQFFQSAYWGTRPNGLKTLRGTVASLIRAICTEWGYQAAKVGGDYLFWSRS